MNMRQYAKRFCTRSHASFALALLLLSGCAATPEQAPSPVSAEQSAALLAGRPILRGKSLPEIGEIDILGMDTEMHAFVESHVERSTRLPERLDQLLYAVIEDTSFGLNYEGRTRTAADTFRYRNGNCLAFTNMFVSMARSVGLEATFQEVDIPPVWDRQGEMIVLNRHINVNVENVNDGGPVGMLAVWGKRNAYGRVIDFNVTDFRTFFNTRLISDERAFAHFYSNLGAEEVRDGNLPLALAFLRRSIEYEPTFAAAWTNLGVLYSRVGSPEMAKLAYERSLYHDPDSVTTRSNLASVLLTLGENERGRELLAQVEDYRLRSPYYRYHLATTAVADGDYDTALKHLLYAVRKQPKEERFHFALSVVYTAQGNFKAAEKELSEAKQLAANPFNRQRYDVKLRQLRISAEEASLAET